MRARQYGPAQAQAGFTYLWLLFALAIGAAGLAVVGQRNAQAVKREREAELIFRGQEIARALAAYAAPPGDGKLPRKLEDLVEDRRGPSPRHHLRRLYTDPFTGAPDWVLLTGADGGIEGVHSRSDALALRTIDIPPSTTGAPPKESDRLFRFDDKEAALSPTQPAGT